MKLTQENLKSICYDYKADRFIPKRNLEYIRSKDAELANEIINKFRGQIISPSFIFQLLENGINSIDELPFCKVCKTERISLKSQKIHDVCSNRCAQLDPLVQQKTTETTLKKFGVKRYFGPKKEFYDIGTHHTQKNIDNLQDLQNDMIMKYLQNSHWRVVAKHFNLTTKSHSSAHKFMKKHGYPIVAISGYSNMEKEIVEFIKSLGITNIQENIKSIISPYELDIFIPEYNLAIEFNGMYWHSVNTKEDEQELKNYHINKTKMCESKGIQLLHIFENEWLDDIKNNIWKSIIRHKLQLSERIYARNCNKKEISKQEAKEFCINNHLQGHTVFSFAEGLFYNNELVMVATYGKPRFNKKYDTELIRLCSKENLCIVGGASKLTKGKTFISYGNRRWCSSISNVYDKIATKLDETSPAYFYIHSRCYDKLINRYTMQKHKLKNILPLFDETKTESENCYANGYRKIFDCGNLVYLHS